jgi:hypothetical protein
MRGADESRPARTALSAPPGLQTPHLVRGQVGSGGGSTLVGARDRNEGAWRGGGCSYAGHHCAAQLTIILTAFSFSHRVERPSTTVTSDTRPV